MISATILTKNSEETLATCLKALEGFDEVIVLDTGSTDLTLDIARTFPNVKVFETPFEGLAPCTTLQQNTRRITGFFHSTVMKFCQMNSQMKPSLSNSSLRTSTLSPSTIISMENTYVAVAGFQTDIPDSTTKQRPTFPTTMFMKRSSQKD